MKKILILTDSLGVPRINPEHLTDDECWVYMINDNFSKKHKMRVITTPGLDSTKLVSLVKQYYQVIRPDIVIIQVGIVDCYPRAIKKNELSILTRLPKVLSELSHKIVKKMYKKLIAYRNIRYVEPHDFKSNMINIKNSFKNSRFVVLPIAPPSSSYKEVNPLIASSINTYNEIIFSVFSSDFLKNCFYERDLGDIFLSDNHHLNTLGHEIVFHKVNERLAKII